MLLARCANDLTSSPSHSTILYIHIAMLPGVAMVKFFEDDL